MPYKAKETFRPKKLDGDHIQYILIIVFYFLIIPIRFRLLFMVNFYFERPNYFLYVAYYSSHE